MKKVFIEKLKQVKDDLAVYEPNSLVHINYVYLTPKKKEKLSFLPETDFDQILLLVENSLVSTSKKYYLNRFYNINQRTINQCLYIYNTKSNISMLITSNSSYKRVSLATILKNAHIIATFK